MGQTAIRKPLKAVKGGARPPATPTMSTTLKEAIRSLGTESLRKELEFLCHRFPAVIHALDGRLLIQGKDVVRYHVDTESEDNTNNEESESESESESDASDESYSGRDSKKRKPIAIRDEEYTARMATCENCKQEFDVTSNNRGDCGWHPGIKTVDYDSSMWCDHDEDCHGPYESFEDGPNYAEGFIWDCCDKPGDDEGCKWTKHKTNANLVVPAPSPVLSPSKKRKVAEEEMLRTSSKKGRRY